MGKIFLHIGFGAVAYSLVELMNKEKLFSEDKFVVIEPLDIRMNGRYDVFVKRDVIWLQESVTKDNMKDLLGEWITKNTVVINLSVNVDSLAVMNMCKIEKALYIDASLENYEEDEVIGGKTYAQIKKSTLYYRQKEAEKIMKGAKKTSVFAFAQNPGFVSLCMKQVLEDAGKHFGIEFNGNYAKLSHDLGVSECLIVEYDSQKAKVESTKQCFRNTWSSVGMQLEGLDNVMMTLSNEDIKYYTEDEMELIKPTDDTKTHVRFLPVDGIDTERRAISVDDKKKPFYYDGWLIPHQENVTIGQFLTYMGNCPSVYYVYRMCDSAIKGFEYVKENGNKPLDDNYVFWAKDIISGWDSVGILLKMKNCYWWCGTVISIEDVRKMKLKSNPTVVQTSAPLLGGLLWMLKHQQEGLVCPEEMNKKEIFKVTEKYLGKVVSKKIIIP